MIRYKGQLRLNSLTTGANLEQANLADANLQQANLMGVNLNSANLTHACLFDDILTETDKEFA